jgi:hypothetical protein
MTVVAAITGLAGADRRVRWTVEARLVKSTSLVAEQPSA